MFKILFFIFWAKSFPTIQKVIFTRNKIFLRTIIAKKGILIFDFKSYKMIYRRITKKGIL